MKPECGSAGIEDRIKSLAAKRNMKNDTIGPVITWTTEAMLGHVDKLLKIPGARLAFGGKELEDHTIPKVYGAIQPTAVFVPLKEILKDEESFKTVTTEVFGPLQVCRAFLTPPLSPYPTLVSLFDLVHHLIDNIMHLLLGPWLYDVHSLFPVHWLVCK